MRILQVIGSLAPRYGGPSTACPALCRALAEAGHEVVVYTTDAGAERREDAPLDGAVHKDGYQVRYFPAWRHPREFKVSPDLLAGLREGVPHFNVAHIYSYYGYWVWAAVQACQERGVPYLLHPHGSLDPFLLGRHPIRKRVYARAIGDRCWSGAAGLLFNSEEERRLTLGSVNAPPGRNSPPSYVVPVGVEPEWFEDPGAPADERVQQRFPQFREFAEPEWIVFFGRLDFKKGLDLLVRAFAEVARRRPLAHLVLAGPESPGYGAKIRNWLEREGMLDRATFTGPLEGRERVAMVRRARMLALLSYSENFGQVVAEAMAARVPVVISDRVNICRNVASAGAGFVVPCDASRAASAMETLLDDPAAARRMGERGRVWAECHWRWATVVQQMVSAYESIANCDPAPRVKDLTLWRARGSHWASPGPRAAASSRALRILHVTETLFPEQGGPDVAVLGLSRALVRRGCEIEIYTTNIRGRGDFHLHHQDSDWIEAPANRQVWRDGIAVCLFSGHWPTRWRASRRLKRALAGNIRRFDIVHIHSLYAFPTAIAARECRRAHVPYLIRPHGSLDPFLRRRHKVRKAIYSALILRRALNGAAAIHYTTEQEERLVGTLGYRPPGIVVPLGLDIAAYPSLHSPHNFQATYPETRGRRIVLYLGRLNFKKGLNLLVRAFGSLLESFPDSHLVLAGPDAEGYGQRVRECLAEVGAAQRATFTGMLHGEAKLAALAAAEVFALPSYTENFALSVAEAMACAVPVVVSDRVNIWPDVLAARAGFVVPCEPARIAIALADVLKDLKSARAMGLRGRAWAREHWDWDVVAEQMLAAYASVIGEAPESAPAVAFAGRARS